MGQIVKKLSAQTTRYYWYPGEKKEWLRALATVGAGVLGFGLMGLVTRELLIAVTVGASVTAALGGLNFGRRDFRATHGFPELAGRALRRAALAHGGRAAWRGLVEGVGGATAAVLIANLNARGVLADWVLPLVPATVGALAHQGGMLYERLALSGTPTDLPPVPKKGTGAAVRATATAAR